MTPRTAAPARTQRERSEATVAELIDAARELFARDGYAATSLDAVCAAAGVTKGALYHHFGGKRDLFRAVYAAEQQRLTDAVAAAYASEADSWAAFYAGCRAFLEATADPGVQRITLLDSTAVLDWDEMRALDADAFEMTKRGIAKAVRDGRLPDQPVEPLAHLLFGAICEAGNRLARSPDPDDALVEVLASLRTLLDGLAVPRSSRTRRG